MKVARRDILCYWNLCQKTIYDNVSTVVSGVKGKDPQKLLKVYALFLSQLINRSWLVEEYAAFDDRAAKVVSPYET